ncbi:hypothetical protein [Tellurirhabdus bombi]|uniref:hypothetical protein n=1 Tax=Tellurirhabdus bombi TaxID=2907205 RepID=UPI001F26C2A6|nr:hypothetical protein [Tellurirhabdus bombi]
MIAKVVAKGICGLFPAEKWFKAIFIFTKYYAHFRGLPDSKYKKSSLLNKAALIEAFMGVPAFSSKIVPLPIQANCLEFLKKPRTNGLVLCTAHVPLGFAWAGYLIDQGLLPDAVIALHVPPDGYWPVFGKKERLLVLPSRPDVLLKAKSILQRGGTVVVLVDHEFGVYSPNMFRLAKKLNSDIIYSFAGLQADGTIGVQFFEAPGACSEEEDEVNLRINAFHSHVMNLVGPSLTDEAAKRIETVKLGQKSFASVEA